MNDQPQRSAPASGSILNLVLVGLVVFFAVKGCEDVSPGPGPDPDWARVEQQAELAIRNYAEGLAEDMRQQAVGVASGQLATKEQIMKDARERTEQTRHSAFLPLGQLDNQNIPDSVDAQTRKRVVDYMEAQARGFERAAR